MVTTKEAGTRTPVPTSFTRETEYGIVLVTFHNEKREEMNNRPDGSYGQVISDIPTAVVDFMRDERSIEVNRIEYVGYVNLQKRGDSGWSHASGGTIKRGRSWNAGDATDNARAKIYEMAFAVVAEVESVNPDVVEAGYAARLWMEIERQEGRIDRALKEIEEAKKEIARVRGIMPAGYHRIVEGD